MSTEEGKKLAEKFGIPFAETSAQTNTNVDEAFMTLAEAVVKRKTEEAGALDYKAEDFLFRQEGRQEGLLQVNRVLYSCIHDTCEVFVRKQGTV